MNQKQDKLFESIMEGLISEGPEIFREALERLFNEAMRKEIGQVMSDIFNAMNKETALSLSKEFAETYKESTPEFSSQESCLRLITAVLQEIHEGWIVGRKYINFEEDNLAESLESPIYRKGVA